MNIDLLAPTGKLVVGHVADMGRKDIERRLQRYDPFLYISWNAKKNNRWGCWEVRRLPEQKTSILMAEYKGAEFYSLEYVENGIINHVMDVPALDLRIFKRLYEMDTWRSKNWGAEYEEAERVEREAYRAKMKEDLRYNMKQHKKMLSVFKEEVKSGVNPFAFFTGRYKS